MQYIYQNALDKACFQHDMAYRDFKDLPRRTAYDNVLCDKAFKIANNEKYDGYQWFINFLMKSSLLLVLLQVYGQRT